MDVFALFVKNVCFLEQAWNDENDKQLDIERKVINKKSTLSYERNSAQDCMNHWLFWLTNSFFSKTVDLIFISFYFYFKVTILTCLEKENFLFSTWWNAWYLFHLAKELARFAKYVQILICSFSRFVKCVLLFFYVSFSTWWKYSIFFWVSSKKKNRNVFLW